MHSIAAEIGCSGDALHSCVRQSERDRGQRIEPSADVR